MTLQVKYEFCAKRVGEEFLEIYKQENLGNYVDRKDGETPLLTNVHCVPGCDYEVNITAQIVNGKMTSIAVEKSGTCIKGN